MHSAHAVVVLLLLGGCANLTAEAPGVDRGIDGVSCIGSVGRASQGLSESANTTLVERAQMQSGKGGVCSAKVFAVTAPIVLYRVFDSSKPYTKFGNWWSLKPPSGSKADYRTATAICAEWSNLDRLVSCQARPGSQLVLGTTQSAVCEDGTELAKTAEIQVYVPNDGKVGIIHVGNCTQEFTWPQPSQ